MCAEGLVSVLAETRVAVDETQIKWRKRPGLKAVEHLPVAIAR